MDMKSLALRPMALFATASLATMLTVFFDWRRRFVRRLTTGPSPGGAVGEAARTEEAVRPVPMTHEIDDALADSFPASDPPAWTPGIARLTPRPASVPA
jgi:hypothetical protein